MKPASTAPVAYEPRSVRAGEWTLTALSDGYLRLDAGGMWGVVPKALWEPLTPAAPDNTILIALRPFLATRGDDVVVIEAGVGQRWDEKWRRIYQMVATETLVETLGRLGVGPGDVTHVIASHAHWDHVGSLVTAAGEPLFPNAKHLAPAIEIEMALRPGHARAPSYRAEDVEPLLARGCLTGFEGVADLLPGVRAHVLGGHSDGVSVITFNEDGTGETAIFWSDVVPTSHHIQPGYIMAYDIDVVRSFEQRSAWLERAAREGWIGCFYHDVDHAFGRVRAQRRRYAFEPE